MKYILTSILILLLTCCDTTPVGESKRKTSNNYTVKIIDGCEYIEHDNGILDYRVYSLTHKGNCKNPIHQYNQPDTIK